MNIKCLLSILLAMVLTPIHAIAASTTATLSVTLTNIAPSASVSAKTIAFGDILSTNSNPTGTGDITVNVTNTAPYTIAINAGLHSVSTGLAGASTCRRMAGNGGVRPYWIYSDSTHSTQWGSQINGSGGSCSYLQSASVVSATGDGANQIHTVYVQAGASNGVGGSLSDTLTITVTY